MQRKRLIMNLVASLGNQIVGILCAFILPKLILSHYGSEINGLISSISQFLAVVSFSEFGVTAVVQSALYKPLANKDMYKVSCIIKSAARFYRRIAVILMVYIVSLCIFYPYIIDGKFDYLYIVLMILILGINSIAQYLLGITNSQLLNADQRGYVVSNANIVANILNTVLCSIFIAIGASIHFVKLVTAVCFLIKPITYWFYVEKRYKLIKDVKYTIEPIKQKWNGVAQHIAYYVMTSTDVLVLTALSTLQNVSVYTVYHLVLNGVNQLLSVVENAVKPLMGEYWARDEKEIFNSAFESYEWIMHLISSVIYGSVATLIVPFVLVYTSGVNDANYNVYYFALIMSAAFTLHYICSPYNTIIMSVGHYKQTQSNFISVACINIVVSVVLVSKYGLIGVAIGTFVARLYQLFWQAKYIYKYILKKKYIEFLELFGLDLIIWAVGIVVTGWLKWNVSNYLDWLVLAVIVVLVFVLIASFVTFLFWREKLKVTVSMIKK